MTHRTSRTIAGVLGILSIAILIGVTMGFAAPEDAPTLAPYVTAFTYQGYLEDLGSPANGTYDFEFKLYNDASAGTQVGSTVTKGDVAVIDGLFTVELDFGSVYDGTALWLEIGVRDGASSGAYTYLSPRQPLTPVPYANYAYGAPWGGLGGVPAGFADGVDNDTTYSAGDGLILGAGQFSVEYAGSGSATTVARSNHDHWSQAWSGSGTGLTLSGGSTGLDASGTSYGVVGHSASTSGTGLYGEATAASGITSGVYGQTFSTDGTGVVGEAGTPNGFTSGVYGISASTSGTGVNGWASATSGFAYGVWGKSNSTSGKGVYGTTIATSGWTFGVHGQSASTDGTGVYGEAIATSGTTYGVYGESASSGGYGVYGTGNIGVAGSGSTGVSGSSASSDGQGVAGFASSTTGFARGLYGYSASSSGFGVYGFTPSTGGHGVGGESQALNGRGVYGNAYRTAGTGVNYGVYGRSNSSGGYGGFFVNDDSSGQGYLLAANDAMSTSDLEFKVSNNGNVYADGAYYCGLSTCWYTNSGADIAERIDTFDLLEAGDVVQIDPDGAGTYRLVTAAYSPMVVGVISTSPAMVLGNDFDPEADDWDDDRPMLALTGRVPVKVTTENGPIQPGDLLVSSSTPGHAMRCEGIELCYGRVIGKALESLDEGIGVIQMLVMLQ